MKHEMRAEYLVENILSMSVGYPDDRGCILLQNSGDLLEDCTIL